MIVLRVYELDNLSSAIPIALEDDKCYCDHNLNGADTVTFEIQRKNENHISIVEEVKVDVFGNRFVIKKVDEHSDFTTVNCELDLDDWKAKLNKNFRMTNSTIEQVLSVIVPNGWTINYESGVDLSKRTTVEKQEGKEFVAVTSHELLDYVADAFSVVFKFDAINKSITVVNPDSYTSSGEFFMEDLNMTELGYNGDSSDFVTRVYAYGKDGLTFASINNNKEYVENVAYSNKIINYVITDERYTVKQNLLAYANRVLNEKCMPQKSYTCSIKNFDGDIWLYKVVTIVDQRRKTRIEHQCVKYREYNDHSLDSITLSSQAPSIEKIVKSNSKTANDLIEAQRTTIYYVIQKEIDEATALITGNQGGYFKWIFDDNGRPTELVNLGDSKDVNTAQQVWRWNQNGLGHSNNGYNGTYGLALTKDGKINASMITTGILNAGVIRAGIIQDVQNSNFWNLETGDFSLSANTTVGGHTVSSIAQTEAESAVNAQTQLSIFNKLTNNGQTQGIYLSDGKLYLNGTYLQAGTISIKDSNDVTTFYANTETGVVNIVAKTFKLVSGDTTKTIPEIANEKASAAVNAQTQQSIFNKLTNNGQTQGIYLQDGKLYLNGTYLQAGIINIKDENDVSTFYANTQTGVVHIVAKTFKLISGDTTKTIPEIANERASAAVNAQTQESIFNKLTNNGQTQGIYLSNGKVYINGTYIQTGTITIKKGTKTTFSANADTGVVNIVADSFSLSNGDTIASIAEDKASAAVNAQTQQTIFNKLTNNGQTQGIYLSGGKVYINAAYIATGTLADAGNNTTFNLSTGTLTMKKGSININDGVFRVTTSGALTATNANVTGKITSKKTVGNDTLKLIIDDADLKGYENSRLFGHLDLCAQSSDGQPHVSLESQKYLHLEAVTATTFDIGGTGATGVEKVIINSSGLHVTSGDLDVYNDANINGDLTVGGALHTNGSNTPKIAVASDFNDYGVPVSWYYYKVVDGILYNY